MKRRTALFCLLFVLFSVQTSPAKLATLIRYAKHAGGWITPATQLWNVLTDYEESTFSMGVERYHAYIASSYYGSLSSATRDQWLSSNGQEYFRTIYIGPDGIPYVDYNWFHCVPEKREYSCSIIRNGAVVWRNTVSSYTHWWLKHQVTRYPKSSIHLSPASGTAQINWTVLHLPGSCGGTSWNMNLSTSVGYLKHNTVRGIEMPALNCDASPGNPLAGLDL